MSTDREAPAPAARVLWDSRGLRVVDYRCQAQPGDRPFAEQHVRHSVSLVRRGSFGCRCGSRSHALVPGALLVGRTGDEYTCTHDHHAGGDACLSFQLEPHAVEEFVGADPAWRTGMAAGDAQLAVLGSLACAAADGSSTLGLDEAAILFLDRFARRGEERPRDLPLSPHAERRLVDAALWLAAHSREPVDLGRAAAQAGFSSFHFLRLFARRFGLTPHQYLIRRRLADAASLLCERDELSVTEIAFEVGFGDLSNFVRTFQKAAAVPPSRFRKLAGAERDRLRAQVAHRARPLPV